MDDKLRELVVKATGRVEAREAGREAEKIRRSKEEEDRDAENFRRKIEGVLGKDVLDAIGPVSFYKNFLRQSMTFQQDSRTFRLQQETGFLVQLEENGRMLGHQFNLGPKILRGRSKASGAAVAGFTHRVRFFLHSFHKQFSSASGSRAGAHSDQ